MIVSIAQAQLFFLALTRILAVLVHIPVLGGNSIPSQVRIAFGVALTFILVPWAPLPADATAMDLIPFTVAIIRELIFGTLAGYVTSLTFAALSIAAEVMGMGSGFSAGRTLNPMLGEAGSAYNQLFLMVAMAFFFVINGHHWLLIALQRSFVVVPINSAALPSSMDFVIRITAQLVASGVQIALPVMLALLLTDIVLGLVSRVAPQVQVFFLGMPLKVGVSLIALSLSFSFMFPLLYNLFSSIQTQTLKVFAQ